MIPPPEKICPPAKLVSHRAVPGAAYSPVALIRRLGVPETGAFVLLDSAGGSAELCRYSFLAWDPRLEVSVRGGQALVKAGATELAIEAGDPFQLIRELLLRLAPGDFPAAAGLNLPLTGGAFGVAGYDAGRYIENLPRRAIDDLGFPELWFIFPRRLICFDHRRSTAHILFEDALSSSLDRAEQAIMDSAAEAPAVPEEIARDVFDLSAATLSNMTRSVFERMVERAKDYIFAGDIFQSNLSQRLALPYAGASLDLYRALRTVNPSPFAGYVNMGVSGFELISSSPERLVQLSGGQAQTRPIAGTRRRGADFAEDGSLTAELNLDPKERAEHIMLVDLERNDLGRVCQYGTVTVDELMVNEAYSHVIHIVSNVKGKLRTDRDALDLLRAMFPGGTITGCPKVRCMEIIDELEPVRRGPYTGSFGYFGYNGNMDMNIIIRTLLRRGNLVYAQAGAGIVADSDPGREFRETLRKAEAMIKAIHLTQKWQKRGQRRGDKLYF